MTRGVVLPALAALGCAWSALAGEMGAGGLTGLPDAEIVILGEVHDNPEHHRNQATAVAALEPAALVLEMLSPSQAAAATGSVRKDRAALADALGWADSGWPGFGMYFPIFSAAPDAEVFGAAVPSPDIRQASAEGAAAAFGPAAARFGLDRPLPGGEQAAREARQARAHCDALPESALPGMVEVQRLRDAHFARTALDALHRTGGPVAVITGTGHADARRGVPAALARAAPEVSVLSVGQVEGDPGPDAPYDLWIVTAPAPRDDPCAAFEGGG